jgi:hypothetical protein
MTNTFTSDSWRVKQFNSHHPEYLQVAKNLTVPNAPRLGEPGQRHEFNTDKHSVEDMDPFKNLKYVEIIAHSESQPLPPPLPRTHT